MRVERRKLVNLAPRFASLDLRTARPSAKTADPFYLSAEWRGLMAQLIRERGRVCQHEGCGRANTRIFGDHIRELKDGGEPLNPGNVRLLCGSCHTRKTAAARAERMAQQHGPG